MYDPNGQIASYANHASDERDSVYEAVPQTTMTPASAPEPTTWNDRLQTLMVSDVATGLTNGFFAISDAPATAACEEGLGHLRLDLAAARHAVSVSGERDRSRPASLMQAVLPPQVVRMKQPSRPELLEPHSLIRAA